MYLKHNIAVVPTTMQNYDFISGPSWPSKQNIVATLELL